MCTLEGGEPLPFEEDVLEAEEAAGCGLWWVL